MRSVLLLLLWSTTSVLVAADPPALPADALVKVLEQQNKDLGLQKKALELRLAREGETNAMLAKGVVANTPGGKIDGVVT